MGDIDSVNDRISFDLRFINDQNVFEMLIEWAEWFQIGNDRL